MLLTETDQIKLREMLKAKISTGKHEIVFEKADKTIRVLRGTRDKDIIGDFLYEKYVNPPPKADGTLRVESKSSLPVFDMEANAWRSFSFEKLISVDGINKNELLALSGIVLI